MWHDENARAVVFLQVTRKRSRHGLEIVADENSIILGGDLQDLQIGQSKKTRISRGPKIDRRLRAQHTGDNILI